MSTMTRSDALELLELSDAATAADISRAYEAHYNDFRIRIDNAPSPTLRARFEASLRRLDEAYALLGGANAGTVYDDLPASAPVPDVTAPARARHAADDARPAPGVLVLRSAEPCQVMVDGAPAGALDGDEARLRLEMMPGAHEIAALGADGRRWDAEVAIEPGRQQLVAVDWSAARAGAPVAARPADAREQVADAPTDAPAARAARPERRAGNPVRLVALAGVAAVVLFAAVRYLVTSGTGAPESIIVLAPGDTSASTRALLDSVAPDTQAVAAVVNADSAAPRPAAITPVAPAREKAEPLPTGDPVALYREAKAAVDRKDWKAANGPLRAAARLGNAEAQLLVGSLCAAGGKIPCARDEGAGWFRKAADQGNAEAQFWFAFASITGHYGATKDPAAARRYYTLAASQGYEEAINSLASSYQSGEFTPVDLAEAMRWYQRGVDLGSADAARGIAYLHLFGRGVPASRAEAVRWMSRSSELGSSYSSIILADWYAKGEHVARDDAEALRWYQRSAELRSDRGATEAARRHEEGVGVPVNLPEALRWYREAKRLGSTCECVTKGIARLSAP